MKLQPQCFSCILRMSVEPLGLCFEKCSCDYYNAVHAILNELQQFRDDTTPPELITKAHNVISGLTGVDDIYSDIKKRDIAIALEVQSAIARIFPKEETIDMRTSLLISAIGNTLDSGISLNDELSGKFENEIKKGFSRYDGEILSGKLVSARTVLVIGDNVGEVVLDRYLLRKLCDYQVYYAVRGKPILNDATLSDVDGIAVDGVKYVSTGSGIAGVVPSQCSSEFRSLFYDADICICYSKSGPIF